MNHNACPLCQSAGVGFMSGQPRRDNGTFDGSGREYWRCRDCQLIFLLPVFHLDTNAEKKRYDSHRNHPGDKDYVRFLKRLADPLMHALSAGDEGLDFGCGPGPTLSVILREAGFPTADYDPIYFPTLDLLERQYDFVTASEVVEHFRQPRAEFMRLKQLVKEERGFLAIMTQMWEGEGDFSRWHYMREPSHVCFYQKETFRYIARWLNWQIDFPQPNVVIYSSSPTI